MRHFSPIVFQESNDFSGRNFYNLYKPRTGKAPTRGHLLARIFRKRAFLARLAIFLAVIRLGLKIQEFDKGWGFWLDVRLVKNFQDENSQPDRSNIEVRKGAQAQLWQVRKCWSSHRVAEKQRCKKQEKAFFSVNR